MPPMTTSDHNTFLAQSLTAARIVPVMVIEDVKSAIPLARALVAGGLTMLEITLRTATAMESVRAIKAEVAGAIVGVGTVLTVAQLRESENAGAAFAVSPGVTDRLMDAVEAMPLLPGSATASEAMRLLERGFAVQKFFPAEPSGGAAYLSSIASPLPQVQFCPTGGITPEKAAQYLALKNVLAVGGSWMVPQKLIAAGDWAGIEALARAAYAIKPVA